MPATRLCHPRRAPRNLRKFFANSGPRGSSYLSLQLSTGVHWPSSPPSWARFLSIIYGGNALPNNTHTLSCWSSRLWGWRTGSLGGERFFNRSRAQNYAKSCSDLRGFPPRKQPTNALDWFKLNCKRDFDLWQVGISGRARALWATLRRW